MASYEQKRLLAVDKFQFCTLHDERRELCAELEIARQQLLSAQQTIESLKARNSPESPMR